MLAEAVTLPEVEVRWSRATALIRDGAPGLLELDITVTCYFDERQGGDALLHCDVSRLGHHGLDGRDAVARYSR